MMGSEAMLFPAVPPTSSQEVACLLSLLLPKAGASNCLPKHQYLMKNLTILLEKLLCPFYPRTGGFDTVARLRFRE